MTTNSFVADLDARLSEVAVAKTKHWWEGYLKGDASFRGVKMADTRRTVADLVHDHALDTSAATSVLEHAHACFEQRWSEDKLAGILLLAEHGLHCLSVDHLDDLAAPLDRGHLSDWNTVDWYCVKVLGPFVVAGDDIEERCAGVARWVGADSLWQRRSGAVAFVNHAATDPELFAGFTDLLLAVAEANARDAERWSQTSVGWLLRELSRRCPDHVAEFVGQHPDLSNEARANATKYLNC